jgi:S-(hydroxymethyl)glutathione dehydrogenase / alcohol dehydrogenase
VRGVVLNAVGADLEVRDDLELDGPGPGEVRVRLAASGVCHSDLSLQDGTLPHPLPCVPGHEGAGTIAAIGDGVTELAEGDHVIISWVPPCGRCAFCLGGQPNLCSALGLGSMPAPHLKLGEQMVFAGIGTATFAEETVVPATAAVKIADDVPFDVASLIGCGVMTGVGAAINTAKVRPGSSVVVIGCGGVGINVIQGARIAGAAEIVAVDLIDQKLEWARQFGATHAVTPDQLGATSAELTQGRGFDYAFEVIGRPETIRSAWEATRRGGTTVVVGAGRMDAQVSFSSFELFYSEKALLGCVYGSADVRTDFDRLLRLWRRGQLDLKGLISRRTDLGGINEAFAAMQQGTVIRTVVDLTR